MSAISGQFEKQHHNVCAIPGIKAAQALSADPGAPAGSSRQAANATQLSCREEDVMQWLRIGKTNYEIGCILEISAFTVKNHLHRIFRKLAVANRTHAIAKFVQREPALGR